MRRVRSLLQRRPGALEMLYMLHELLSEVQTRTGRSQGHGLDLYRPYY